MLPGSYYGAGHHTFAPHNAAPPAAHDELEHGPQGTPAVLSATRLEASLHDALTATGLVYGAFSNLAKVNRAVWEAWCRILERRPRLRLWAIQEPAFGVHKLREAAEARGVGAFSTCAQMAMAERPRKTSLPVSRL